MKKGSLAVRMLVLLSLLALAAACGGGGGDGGGGGSAPLATGLFTKTTATVSDGTSGTGLMYASGTYAHWQHLYLATAVKGSGKITGLAFKYGGAMSSAVTCTGTTIKLGHTSLNAVTSTFATNVSNGKGGQTTVLSDGTLSFPAGAVGTWQTVTFTTPFDYNGVDNLVVDVERTAACTGNVKEEWHSDSYNGTTWSFTPAALNGNAPGTWIQNIKLTFAGGDNLANYGTPSSDAAPFSTNAAWRHLQMLHSAATISGSGPITGIGMVVYSVTSAATYTVTIKVGHSTLSALTTNYANNFSDSPVTVANALTFTVPAGVPAGSTVWLPFTGNFSYNGTDNLIVDVDVAGASVNTPWTHTYTGSAQSLFGAYGSTTGGTDFASLHTKFRFNGGMMSKLSAGSGMNDTVFNGTYSSATRYSAADLGTAGNITSVACRLSSASTGTSYANFKVVMGLATGSTLSATAAGSFAGQNTVYSGTYTVPAGLQAGDWLDIPLSSSFSYDGKSDLIVWMGNGGTDPGTTAVNYCMGESNSARYPSGLAVSTTGVGSDFSYLLGWTTDIRMAIQK